MKHKIIHDELLLKNKISYTDICNMLSDMSASGAEYADLYFQSVVKENWILEKKTIKKGSWCSDEGIGTRVINGDKVGLFYTSQITKHGLYKSFKFAKDFLKKSNIIKKNYSFKTSSNKTNIKHNLLHLCSSEEKLDIMHDVDRIARSLDKRVKEVVVNYSDEQELILVTSTDGTFGVDIRPMIKIYVEVIVEDKMKLEFGNSGGGGRINHNFFLEKKDGITKLEYYAHKAVEMALINLKALPSPAGTFPVILGPGWPGILLHEAVGHGLEGDFNRQNVSVFSNKIGEMVASKLCTIIDDGTIDGARGSISIDDEGTPSKRNILIENGILKQFMQDKYNAKVMNTVPTGNARRESYASLPMPRMTNTYMLPGQHTIQELIESVDYGIYATNFRDGQVDITSGNFVFYTSEAFLIKNGKVHNPIKHVMLIGSGIEVMKKISMVGNDLKLDNGLGTCIKNGYSVPVCVGQPSVKIDNLTIGGSIT